MTVFTDTSGLYAVLDRDDSYHLAARQAWIAILSGLQTLVTSNYIVVETTALVQHRLGMQALQVFFNEIMPVLHLEWLSPIDHQAAVAAVLAANRRRLSLVDCSSFELMRRLGIGKAFSFDPHFKEQGFEVIPL